MSAGQPKPPGYVGTVDAVHDDGTVTVSGTLEDIINCVVAVESRNAAARGEPIDEEEALERAVSKFRIRSAP